MKRNPVLLAMSVLATLQVLAGGAFFADLLGARWAVLISLGVAAVQYGVQYWVRGQVTPLAEPRDDTGRPLFP